jgi:dipeptidase D
VNLDSEDEGEIFIGCAGGVDTLATLSYTPEVAPSDYDYYRVDVSGLCGGHSGDDIDKGRANSNKLVARLLFKAAAEYGARLSHFDGGNLRNAIPREAYAIVGVPHAYAAQFEHLVASFAEQFKAEYAITEPNMKIVVASVAVPQSVMDASSQHRLLLALVGVPNGVLAMSMALPGLVETSTNLASVKFEEQGKVVITTSQRSSVDSAKEYAMYHVESVFSLAGCEVVHSDGYPGWSPNPDSELLEWTKAAYLDLFGKEPKVRAIHAGLECGLFLERNPQLEMVSFGPTLRGVHSPDERLEIATVDKFWRLLVEVLQRVK